MICLLLVCWDDLLYVGHTQWVILRTEKIKGMIWVKSSFGLYSPENQGQDFVLIQMIWIVDFTLDFILETQYWKVSIENIDSMLLLENS